MVSVLFVLLFAPDFQHQKRDRRLHERMFRSFFSLGFLRNPFYPFRYTKPNISQTKLLSELNPQKSMMPHALLHGKGKITKSTRTRQIFGCILHMSI